MEPEFLFSCELNSENYLWIIIWIILDKSHESRLRTIVRSCIYRWFLTYFPVIPWNELTVKNQVIDGITGLLAVPQFFWGTLIWIIPRIDGWAFWIDYFDAGDRKSPIRVGYLWLSWKTLVNPHFYWSYIYSVWYYINYLWWSTGETCLDDWRS